MIQAKPKFKKGDSVKIISGVLTWTVKKVCFRPTDSRKFVYVCESPYGDGSISRVFNESEIN